MENIEQLVETLSKDAVAAKPAPHPFLLSLKWLAVAAAYLVISLTISGMRPDLAGALQNPWFIAEIAALIGILITTALSAAVLAFPDLHQKRATAFTPVWMFGIFVLVILFAWRADNPPAPFPVHSFECTLSILLFSLLPTAGIFYAMRKFASTHLRTSGIVAALFAFSTGALWLRLHEVNNSVTHVIEWHYLPMFAVGILGLWLGKKLLQW